MEDDDWTRITRDTPAPKDRRLLLFGKTVEGSRMVRQIVPIVFTGYWDVGDEAWCSTGSHWDGPFWDVTHFKEIPEGPKDA